MYQILLKLKPIGEWEAVVFPVEQDEDLNEVSQDAIAESNGMLAPVLMMVAEEVMNHEAREADATRQSQQKGEGTEEGATQEPEEV
jgi:hypothetical protein